MATPATNVRDYCALLAKSRLVPAGEVEALQRKWKEETGGTDEKVEAFGKYLVHKRVLTTWQAALLRRGRAEGFFLGGYKILEQLGKGQMGGVYKAVHPLGQVVALKILPASRAKDPRLLARFQREARLLTQLDHPNVVRAFQVGEDGGRHFIVMEFLEGETLDEVLTRRGRLPVGEAVRAVRQALDGLQHLHERRMVHRDLKPANLMVCPAGAKGAADNTLQATVKILDVGLGRGLLDAGPEGDAETQITAEGSVVGTPDYMAPEQARDARTADVRADVYSLGCVLYHCLTGQPPFPDTNIMSQMLRHATEDPPPLSATLADVPPGLQGALDTMLAKQPDRRLQTPAAAAEALKRFQTPGAGAAPTATHVVPAFGQWLASESGTGGANPSLPSTTGLTPQPIPQAATRREPAPAPPARPPAVAPRPASPPQSQPAPVPVSGSHPDWLDLPSTAQLPQPPVAVRPLPPPPAAYPAQPGAIPSWQPAAAYAAPVPVPMSLPSEPEVEVELVAYPPAAAPAPADRSLLDLDRRDLILLTAGGFGVLGAVGLGYGLSRLLRSLTSSTDPENPEER